MNKALLFSSFLLLILISCKTETTPSKNSSTGKVAKNLITEEDKTKLTYLKEVEWPKAYREQDTLLLDRILGDDFQMIDQAGNWFSKKDELDWIKKNAMETDSFYYEIKRFDLLENGTAIICGTGHIFKDTIKSTYQSSNVLVKRDDTWKAVLSHVSGVKNMEE